ncbi:MAG: hypothetical protein ACOYOL_05360 [Chthoniobacterales bacterium]|jgi:hypothetical protein
MTKLLLPLFLAVLCGCATTSKPSMEAPAYLQELAAMKIDPATYGRISKGRVLGYSDIMVLVRKDVPGKMIVPYLRATRTPYNFSTAEINRLIDAGADDVLVNYLGKDKGIYLQDENNAPTQGAGLDHPYYADPGYMGPAPFDFGYPGEWYGDRGGYGGGGHGGGHGGR